MGNVLGTTLTSPCWAMRWQSRAAAPGIGCLAAPSFLEKPENTQTPHQCCCSSSGHLQAYVLCQKWSLTLTSLLQGQGPNVHKIRAKTALAGLPYGKWEKSRSLELAECPAPDSYPRECLPPALASPEQHLPARALPWQAGSAGTKPRLMHSVGLAPAQAGSASSCSSRGFVLPHCPMRAD